MSYAQLISLHSDVVSVADTTTIEDMQIFYWYDPSRETNRFPTPYMESFQSTEPFTTTEQEVHPGTFDSAQFDQIWKDEPLTIDSSSVTVSTEQHFRGAAFRLRFHSDKLARRGVALTRGLPIIFGGVSWNTAIYVVTWKRWDNQVTALVQVSAFLRDQRTFSPYSPTWPSFLIEVPSDRCFVPCPPAIPRPPYIPPTYIETLRRITAELEAVKKMNVFKFMYTKLPSI